MIKAWIVYTENYGITEFAETAYQAQQQAIDAYNEHPDDEYSFNDPQVRELVEDDLWFWHFDDGGEWLCNQAHKHGLRHIVEWCDKLAEEL